MVTTASATARCRDCGELVIWTRTERGRARPLDYEPDVDGTYELVPISYPGEQPYRSRRILPGVQIAPERRRTCHFDTCTERTA